MRSRATAKNQKVFEVPGIDPMNCATWNSVGVSNLTQFVEHLTSQVSCREGAKLDHKLRQAQLWPGPDEACRVPDYWPTSASPDLDSGASSTVAEAESEAHQPGGSE